MSAVDHRFFQATGDRSRRLQKGIREATFAPDKAKALRLFSSWETAELILRVNLKTLQKRLLEPGMPTGSIEADGQRQRWFSIGEINEMRARWRTGDKRPLLPFRPQGARAIRVGISNFKGGSGKSTVALHFAHAAALAGYRVLLVDFDPQATLSHAMGINDIGEEKTVWGIIARDLARETERMNLEAQLMGKKEHMSVPDNIKASTVLTMRDSDFIQPTCWPTIDIIGSCANAAFVEFATGEYRMRNRMWSFFASMDRYLDGLPNDRYDIVIFDNPPAIGYQALNAVFAADILYVPSGPAYWEYDSTTSFVVQLGDALEEIALGFAGSPEVRHKLPKTFQAVRFLLTRFEVNNELHLAMQDGVRLAFGDALTQHPIEMTRAVEQSGRLQQSIYEIDYRGMTRETWKRARKSFDAAFEEFIECVKGAWPALTEATTADGFEAGRMKA